MKFNKWTLGLAAAGVVSLTSAARADESKPSPVQTALSNTTISGYVSASANVGLTDGYANSPAANIPFQKGELNGFSMDVVSLSISKPEDATPWAAGYNVQLWLGPDAAGFNPAVNGIAGNGTTTDFAVKQAYVTLNAPLGNGLDFKVGVFDSPVGYEDTDSVNDPNFTRSWGKSFEPTELTGLLATYKFCDAVAFSGGVVNTSEAIIDSRNGNPPNSQSSWKEGFLGDLTLTAPASWGSLAGSTFSAGVIYGYNASPTNTLVHSDKAYPVSNNAGVGFMGNDQINYYAGLTLTTPWKQFTAGATFDFVENAGGGYEKYTGFGGSGGTLEMDDIAVGIYGTYKASDKLSLSGRMEYVEQDDYYRNIYGNSDNLVELTGTVEYDLWANVISRVEVRWDQDLGTTDGSLEAAGTTGHHERCDVGLYANIIYKF